MQVFPDSPTIQITISPLQCLTSTKQTELNQILSSYLAENTAVSITLRGKVMLVRKIITVYTNTQKLGLCEEVEVFNVQAGGTMQ